MFVLKVGFTHIFLAVDLIFLAGCVVGYVFSIFSQLFVVGAVVFCAEPPL